jgi:hypothetical protein
MRWKTLAFLGCAVACGVACGGAYKGAAKTGPAAANRTAAAAIDLPDPSFKLVLLWHDERVEAVQLTSDGLVLAATRRGLLDFDPKVPEALARTRFPTVASTILLSAKGDRALLELAGKRELWDTHAKKRIATVALEDGAISAAMSDDGSLVALGGCGAQMPRPKGAQGAKRGLPNQAASDDPCGYGLFRGSDGALLRKIPVDGPEDLSNLRFSGDGRYMVQTGIQKRMIYDVANGRLALRRMGGRIDGGSPDGNELFVFEGDKLLISRFGLLEYDDLVTGKVIGSQHYGDGGADESIRHLRVEGRTMVATLLAERKRLILWDYASKKPPQTIALSKFLPEPCFGCEMIVKKNQLHLTSDPELVIDLDSAKVSVGAPRTKESIASETLAENSAGRIVRAYEDRTAHCKLMPKARADGTELEGVVLDEAFCTAPVMSESLVASHSDGRLVVLTLPDGKSIFGPATDRKHRRNRFVSNGHSFGMQPQDRGATLWLAQREPATFPALKEQGQVTIETESYQFALQRDRKSADATLIVQDGAGTEVMREAIGGFAADGVFASGGRIVLGRGKGSEPKLTTCQVGKGCKPLPLESRVYGLVGAVAMLRRDGVDKDTELYNLDTGQRQILVGCKNPAGLTESDGALRALCVGAPSRRTLLKFDAQGQALGALDMGELELGYPIRARFAGHWALATAPTSGHPPREASQHRNRRARKHCGRSERRNCSLHGWHFRTLRITEQRRVCPALRAERHPHAARNLR